MGDCTLTRINVDTNTDTKVKQTATTTSANYEVLFSSTADNTTRTEGARKNNNLLFNPSSGNLQTTQLNGVNIGSAPKFTDTTYSAEKGISLSSNKFGHSNDAITAQSTQAVYPIKIDAYGHITSYGSAQTIPVNVSELTNDSGYTTNTGTVTSVKIAATSPIAVSSTSAITTSGTRTISHATSGATAGSYGDSNAQTPVYGGTFKVPYVTINDTGHVTSISEHTVKIPASDNTDHRKSFYATCDTAADTAAKVATLANSDGWELKAGTIVGVKFTNTNTVSNCTLNVNGTGDKSLYYNNAIYTDTSSIICGYANRIIYYMYDGTNWCWFGDGRHDGNTDTKVRQTLKTDNVDRPLLMAYSNNTVTTGNVDNVAYRNNSIYANASTGNIQATKLNGVDIGSSPKFTDTTYTAEKGIILSSGKFGHSNTAITAQTIQAVYPIKIDAYGHITAYGSAVTVPAAVAVKGNAESSYRTGNVNLTPANLGLESKTAASGGTTISLVTTGEKYIWNNINTLLSGSHNSIYRGKKIGTSFTDAQKTAIANGTFDDMWLGDYWTINSVNWRIWGFDWYMNKGQSGGSGRVTKHHVVILPDTVLINTVQMHTSNINSMGYYGASLRTDTLPTCLTQVETAFGATYILAHEENLMTNGDGTTKTWVTTKIEVPSTMMIVGAMTTQERDHIESIFPLSNYNPQLLRVAKHYWLRDAYGTTGFWIYSNNGALTAYDSMGLSGLGIRPYFLLSGN